MVKKTSFFGKLKSRLRTSSVQVDDAPSRTRAGGNSRINPARAEANAVAASGGLQAVSGRKISKKEEAVFAINEGFAELAKLLRGMHNRIEVHSERIASATRGVDQLPALSQSQVDLLRVMADRLEKQNDTNEMIAKSLGDLPETLQGVRSALERAAVTDERTAKTLDEFRGNMETIQGTMGDMVAQSKRQADATERVADGQKGHIGELADKIVTEQARNTDAVAGMVEQLAETQQSNLGALREAHADQASRLNKLVEDGTKTDRAILIVLALAVVALLTIAGLLIAGQG